MANKITNTDNYTAIANAIRAKLGVQTTYTPPQMAAAIASIPQGGADFSEIKSIRGLFSLKPELLKYAGSIDWGLLRSSNKRNDEAFANAVLTAAANEDFQEYVQGISVLDAKMFYYSTYLTAFDYASNIIPSYSDLSYIFENCYLLDPKNAIEALETALDNDASGGHNLQSALHNCGKNRAEGAVIGDVYLKGVTTATQMFQAAKIEKIGNLTLSYTSGAQTFGNLFDGCTALEEVGLISGYRCNANNAHSLVLGCTNLKKFGGLYFSNQGTTNIITTQSSRLLGTTSFTKLEEILNVPVSYFQYGGTQIANMAGTASSPKPLRRLTFNTTNIAYTNKTNYKSFSIAYCSFDRDGMVEMFNSLPNASDVTGAKVITITGNPCVTDGTLTADDIAIATAKGYSITQ